MITRIIKIANEAFSRPSSRIDSLWYEIAGEWVNDTARDFDLSHETVAGFVAALSPLNSWDSQLKYTAPAIAGCLESGQSGIVGVGFHSNKLKAARIIQGENPLDVLGGDKVRNFYRNLCGDFSAVTIDRHAIKVSGFSSKSADAGSLTSKTYGLIADAFKDAASHFSVSPASLQALTWVYWRDTN